MSTLHASQDLINLIKQINLDTNYPIGSIYLSFDKNSPGSRLGGTWQLCGSGRYLMCYDPNNAWFDKPGSDKGTASGPGNWRSEDTNLTIDQIPSHNHGQSTLKGSFEMRGYAGSDENPILSANGITSVRRVVWSGNHDVLQKVNMANKKTNYIDINASHTHSSNGGGQGHNHFHVSPYMIVCVWERTA